MTKQELEKAIENGESVWVVDKDLKRVIPYYADSVIINGFNTFPASLSGYKLEDIYKTKAEAEHYLYHANVTRTEQLPFSTWEEFLKNKNFEFFDKNGILTWLYINTSKTSERIHLNNRFEKLNDWDLTEANFYKAYDECVRLFRGDE